MQKEEYTVAPYCTHIYLCGFFLISSSGEEKDDMSSYYTYTSPNVP